MDKNFNKGGGVYIIRNLINGKVYVGSSRDFLRRYDSHHGALRRGVHAVQLLQDDFNKYGTDSFEMVVVKYCKKDIEVEEVKAIRFYDSINSGYNSTLPALIGLGDTSLVRESSLVVNNDNPYGVVCLDKDSGILLDVYRNKEEASVVCKCRLGGIKKCLDRDRLSHRGFVFVYNKDYDSSRDYRVVYHKGGNDKELYQYDLEGNLVYVWEKTKDAVEHYGCSSSSLNTRIDSGKKYLDSYWSRSSDYKVEKKYINPTIERGSLEWKVIYETEGSLVIKEYKDIGECVLVSGLKKSGIESVLYGYKEKYKGRVFIYRRNYRG